VHAARGDVLVARLSCQDRPVGFLPFHQIDGIALPAGRFFNDAHNVVISPSYNFDWRELLRACNLKAYDFHAMVGTTNFVGERFCHGQTQSFSAVIGDDSEKFLHQLEQDHKTIRKQEQKTRKLEREIGPVTLEMDCRDGDLLKQAISWKRQQYRRANILDLFIPDWTRDLVERLHRSTGAQNRGILSVLRAGDKVVAAHFGLIEGDLLHYWFPAYHVDYSQYSPGTALFKQIIRSSSQYGIKCVDMGYGEQPYKRKQTDTITYVSHGSISRSRLHCEYVRAKKAITAAFKQLPMKQQLKQVLRMISPKAGVSKLG
jgi:CelD/BcsL family acetyltransferase involved in cellulose biosynthesis